MKALKILLGLVAVTVLWGAYVKFYKEPHAEAKAREFCASVKEGDPADGLLERALAKGAEPAFAKWHSLSDKYRTTDERELLVIFTGLPPFSRHICDIKATTRVIEAHYVYMD
jgi:hypothetical protein